MLKHVNFEKTLYIKGETEKVLMTNLFLHFVLPRAREVIIHVTTHISRLLSRNWSVRFLC